MDRFKVIASVALFIGGCLAAPAFAQGLGARSDAHRTHRPPSINNQFNLPAYSPMLMPYSPPLGGMRSGEQRTAPQHPPHSHAPFPPMAIAFFCAPLGGYFPAVQHCPTQWIQVHTDPANRWR